MHQKRMGIIKKEEGNRGIVSPIRPRSPTHGHVNNPGSPKGNVTGSPKGNRGIGSPNRPRSPSLGQINTPGSPKGNITGSPKGNRVIGTPNRPRSPSLGNAPGSPQANRGIGSPRLSIQPSVDEEARFMVHPVMKFAMLVRSELEKYAKKTSLPEDDWKLTLDRFYQVSASYLDGTLEFARMTINNQHPKDINDFLRIRRRDGNVIAFLILGELFKKKKDDEQIFDQFDTHAIAMATNPDDKGAKFATAEAYKKHQQDLKAKDSTFDDEKIFDRSRILIPIEILESITFKVMRDLTNDHVILMNDIFSYERECATGVGPFFNNSLGLIMHLEKEKEKEKPQPTSPNETTDDCRRRGGSSDWNSQVKSLEPAAGQVINVVDDRAEKLNIIFNALMPIARQYPALGYQFAVCQRWLHGNVYWSTLNERYTSKTSPFSFLRADHPVALAIASLKRSRLSKSYKI